MNFFMVFGFGIVIFGVPDFGIIYPLTASFLSSPIRCRYPCIRYQGLRGDPVRHLDNPIPKAALVFFLSLKNVQTEFLHLINLLVGLIERSQRDVNVVTSHAFGNLGHHFNRGLHRVAPSNYGPYLRQSD
jgi:hypothetical protein